MKPLLLHGFDTSIRVNGRTLEIDWQSEGRKEIYRPQQLDAMDAMAALADSLRRFRS